MDSKLKRLAIGPYEWAMFALVALATIARFVLIYNNWPTTNSDEGNMALVALHVAYNGEWPIFFYGLPYLGPVEGYIAAPLFHLFGPSIFSLRLGLLLLFPPFVISMYYLTRMLYTRPFALGVVVLLCLGSKDLISRELKGVGEYAESELFAALISLIVAYLARQPQGIVATRRGKESGIRQPQGIVATRREGERAEKWGLVFLKRRLGLYGVLGLIVGIALWVDLLILPFVASGALMLWLFCRRELWSRYGFSLLLGLVIGMMPLIIYNAGLRPPNLDQNSFNVLLNIHHSGAEDLAKLHLQLPWLRQLAGTFLVAIPIATGANPLCPIEAIPSFGITGVSLPCAILQGSWGVGVVVLGIIAAVMAIVACWPWRAYLLQSLVRIRRGSMIILNPRIQQELILQCARLMLLVSGGLTLILYVISPSPAVVPWTSARYLTLLVVVFPAMLWPLWNGLRKVGSRSAASEQQGEKGMIVPQVEEAQHLEGQKRSIFGRGAWIARIALLCLLLAIFVQGTVMTFAEIPLGQAFYKDEGTLVSNLLRLGATRIYSEYWTCNRLTFRSQEQIVCAALDEQLRPGFDRYAPYREMVRSAPRRAYVFPQDSQQNLAFERKIQEEHITVDRYVFGNDVVYIPASNEGLP